MCGQQQGSVWDPGAGRMDAKGGDLSGKNGLEPASGQVNSQKLEPMAPFSFGLVADERGDQFSRYKGIYRKNFFKNLRKNA